MPLRATPVALLLAFLSGCQCGVSRTGTARPQIEAEPASLDFGSTTPGLPVERSVTLRNQSIVHLTISEVTLTGEAASLFLVGPLETLLVEPGGSVSARVVYSPTEEGVHSARLVVRSDATNAPELLVPIAGTARSADACAHVTCTQPPGPCFREAGSCAGGSCTYLPRDEGTACDDGDACTAGDACRAGNCQGTALSCTTPPAGTCSGPTTFVSFESPGACVAGACQYTQTSHPCAAGCTGSTCQSDVCAGVTCTTPPPCFTGGACVGGSCQYQVALGASCSDGNACTVGDACGAGGVCSGTAQSCANPPPPTCLDPQTRRSFDAVGSCGAGGACSYTSHDVSCALGCEATTGQCRTMCPAGQHPCSGQCVTNASLATCGASCTPCAAPANGTATCDGASCGVTCNPGFHLCSGQCVANTSTSSCGASCTPCAAPAYGTATCDGASCGVTCNSGFHLCGNQCLSSTSTSSCGTSCSACAVPANGAASCDGTSCGLTCNPGFHLCGGQCVANTSTSSCGGSCTACPAPTNGTASCDGASCGVTCNAGYASCAQGCCASGAATQVSSGMEHTCALTAAGGVKCWGSNDSGQVGDGTSGTNRLVPTNVSGLAAGVTAITSGGSHACALTTTGGVKCWGSNAFGQLGDGTSGINRLVPTDVSGLASGVTSIVAGAAHTCALTAAGGVKCWGYNISGEVGDGTSGTSRLLPTDVVGLASGVTAIAAGATVSCAVTAAGGVKCWGDNFRGQVGDGTNTTRFVPTDVSGLASGVTAVAAGSEHTCALTTAGGVKCWGSNFAGQIGDGTSGTDRLVPTGVSGLASGVAAISAADWNSCAVSAAGGGYCWGYNVFGQIGDGTSGTNRLVPTGVSGLASGVAAISVGDRHSCTLTTAGGIKCWGWNSRGQLGDGTITNRLTPVSVVSFP